MNNQAVNQDSNDEMKLPKMEDIFAPIPFFSLFLYFALVISFFVNLFSPIFSNIYDKTIVGYQLWRIFTSLFYETSFLMTIIVIVNLTTFLHQLEYRLSTTVLVTQFLFGNILIQLIALLVQFFMKDTGLNENLGVCGIWFCMMFKFCFYNQNGKIKICCFPWKIKRIAYPYVLFLVLSIVFLRIRLQIVIGLFVALVECYALRGHIIGCSSCFYRFMDNFFQLIRIGRSSKWVNYRQGNINCWVSASEAYDKLDLVEEQGKQNSVSEETNNNEHFSNMKGISLNQ